MTDIKISEKDLTVKVTGSDSRITVVEQPVRANIRQINNELFVKETTNQISLVVPTAVSVLVAEPADTVIQVETTSPSLATVLESVRTNFFDTDFTYNADGSIASISNNQVTKTMTYLSDGRLSTVTTSTDIKTIVRTFNYNDDKRLVSVSVS